MNGLLYIQRVECDGLKIISNCKYGNIKWHTEMWFSNCGGWKVNRKFCTASKIVIFFPINVPIHISNKIHFGLTISSKYYHVNIIRILYSNFVKLYYTFLVEPRFFGHFTTQSEEIQITVIHGSNLMDFNHSAILHQPKRLENK